MNETENKSWVTIGLVLFSCALIVLGSMVWLTTSIFSGTELTEKELTHAQQLEWLNRMSPVLVPEVAGDIRIKYESFQDWHFEGEFSLPQKEFDQYVNKLRPRDGEPDVFEGRTIDDDGGYFAASSIIRVDRAAHRVTIVSFTT